MQPKLQQLDLFGGPALDIGGVKEKVTAAHRAGIKEIILPDHNRKDLED